MICDICPRNCGAERDLAGGTGYCGMPAGPVLARAALHFWEEPCISGTKGTGAVFFSGCNLGCIFCQNNVISHEHLGKTVTVQRLQEIFSELLAQGAHSIDLVSPSIFAPWIAQALEQSLPVPVIWNSGGYDRVETLRQMEGKVQIYLPDMKYALETPAREYSGAADYPETAKEAICEMYRQVGPCRMGEDGLLRSGVLIRHLLLPGQLENARRVMDWISETFPPGAVLFSLMGQYTPQPGAQGLLARRTAGAEYRAAVAYMENCGITRGYTQEISSARTEYTPSFDFSGI